MSGYFYLLWTIAHQQISQNQGRQMSEDEFYENYGGSPSRFSVLLKRFFMLVRSMFFRSKHP
ncbi:hypothetical protein [Phyllobacterium sp. K27]